MTHAVRSKTSAPTPIGPAGFAGFAGQGGFAARQFDSAPMSVGFKLSAELLKLLELLECLSGPATETVD